MVSGEPFVARRPGVTSPGEDLPVRGRVEVDMSETHIAHLYSAADGTDTVKSQEEALGGKWGERDRLRPISTSASFFSTSANFDFGQFRLRPIFGC